MNRISLKKTIAIASLAVFTAIASQTSMALMTSEEAVEAALLLQPGDFEEVVQVEMDGRDVWQVAIIDAEGAEVLIYFDVETGAPVDAEADGGSSATESNSQ